MHTLYIVSLFAAYVGGAIYVYKRFSNSVWLHSYKVTRVYNRQQRIQRRADRQAARIAAARLDEWNAYTPPTYQDLIASVQCDDNPATQRMLNYIALAYVSDNKELINYHYTVSEYKTKYQQLVTATNDALARYTAALPSIYRQPRSGSPFTVTVTPTEAELERAHAAAATVLRTMNFSFRSSRENNPLSRPSEPSRPARKSWDESGKHHREQMAEYKDELRQFERDRKEYDKTEEAILENRSLTQTIFWNTPLYSWAEYLIPYPFQIAFSFPDASRFAGTWICAPPGRGKTNLLHTMVFEDAKTPCTIIMMDSKGDLINAYRAFPDVVVIDPHSVEINPFQLGSSTRTLDFLEYIFSALLETKLTPKQTTLFRCCLALMLKIPNATIDTFRRVLVHGWQDQSRYVMELDEDNRDFFFVEGRKSEFDGGQYSDTKQEVLQRLRLLVSNEYLKQIFTAPRSNTDFFKLLDSGKTIIIDNSKDILGENGAEFFGRFFVAMVWMAAVSRSKQRQHDKVAVSFYIDECHTVIKRDTKITTILDECRSQKIALVMAHQRIAQIEPQVMDALNNCAIRLANSDDDAEALAKRFRVEASALRLPIGQFSCFVRDKTPTAVTINLREFDTSVFPPIPEYTAPVPPEAPDERPEEPLASSEPGEAPPQAEPKQKKQKPFKKDRAKAVPNDDPLDFG